MAGAYTAKPVTASVPDVPPGWNPDWWPIGYTVPYWPFPGPLPPGYEMELSLVATATGPVNASGGVTRYNSISNVVATLLDHEEYQTNEPSDDEITLTAAIGGRAVMTPTSVSYSEFEGSFWGNDDNYLFSLVESDRGKTIVLTATTIVFGSSQRITGVATISVYDPTYSLSIESAESPITVDDATSAVEIVLYDNGTYATNEPADYEMTITATIDGREVMTPLTVSYSESGGFWGYSGSLEFNLTDSDAEETIVISVEGTVWGDDEVSDTTNITIDPLAVPVSIETTLIFNSYTVDAPSAPKMRLKVERLPSHSSRRDWPQIGANETGAPPETWWESNAIDNLAEISCTTDISGTKSITATGTFLTDSNYQLTYDINEGGNATVDVTFSVAVTMSDSSVLSGEVNHVIAPYGSTEVEYVTVSTATGIVYIFGVQVN